MLRSRGRFTVSPRIGLPQRELTYTIHCAQSAGVPGLRAFRSGYSKSVLRRRFPLASRGGEKPFALGIAFDKASRFRAQLGQERVKVANVRALSLKRLTSELPLRITRPS
jgi:hypothetical protein